MEDMQPELQYNKFTRTGSFEGMEILTNADKMVEAAEKLDEKQLNAYRGVAHFIRAYKFFDLTLRVGDIPYSEAMFGEKNDNFFPKYDTQREVFIGILNELEKANDCFAKASNFTGDPVYKGSVKKWQKLVNSYELKILIHLYNKTDDADLKVKQRFEELIAKPLFESNADNFQLVYSNKTRQKYPYYKENNNYLGYTMFTSVLIDSLKSYKDNRLFYYAEPTPKSKAEEKSPSDWDSYRGIDPILPYTVLQDEYNKSPRNYCELNNRYIDIPEGEPIYMFSYADVKFILAEASVRGLLAGDAKKYYEDGVTAAMKFVADNTPATFNHGMPITNEYITQYLGSAPVKFATTKQRQIEQIIMQKYISTFLQEPFGGYWEMRRTGIPNIPINPKTNLNIPSDKMPLRWMYPDSEFRYNSENVKEAVARQYGGDDSPMGVMWLLQ